MFQLIALDLIVRRWFQFFIPGGMESHQCSNRDDGKQQRGDSKEKEWPTEGQSTRLFFDLLWGVDPGYRLLCVQSLFLSHFRTSEWVSRQWQ